MTRKRSGHRTASRYPFTEFLFQHYIPVPESGCWLWLGTWSGDGYGRIGNQRGFSFAHREFYEKHIGPIPAGALVCHKCDTPSCVNPDHLYAGTEKQNADDMMRRGRHFHAYEERHGCAKLSKGQVEQIRSLQGLETKTDTAAKFGISRRQVGRIQRRESWFATM